MEMEYIILVVEIIQIIMLLVMIHSELYGDETLWWVFNDKGNIHTESEADPFGS